MTNTILNSIEPVDVVAGQAQSAKEPMERGPIESVEEGSTRGDELEHERSEEEEQPPAKRARTESTSFDASSGAAQQPLDRSPTEPPSMSKFPVDIRLRSRTFAPRDPPNSRADFFFLDIESNDATISPNETEEEVGIFEIAVCATNSKYEPLDGGLSLLVHPPNYTPEDVFNSMPEEVQEMHEKSGLLEDLRGVPENERINIAKAEELLIKYFEKHGAEPEKYKRGILAGTGVAYDRQLVRVFMPELDKLLTHQNFDVTSIWRFVRSKFGRSCDSIAPTTHRAMQDIKKAMNDAKTYSEAVLKSPQGVKWPKGFRGAHA
ncbi:hypothetical protein SCHPADRAFT_940945 [Schizopora paradoxa]|uniref:Exonuclease domain-containing protein n=1 Tax=Schizopora paradoxa TaxID=27342 RepID=A0A0H2RLC1_9AGAM|nr:hypothetical protein SCHPADRAFT_940945 [Schizopora paradoxa]